jgi:hypothetical protein
MANEKQKQAFFRYVSSAKARGEQWAEMVPIINDKNMLGSEYTVHGIRALYSRMKKRNLDSSLGLDSVKLFNDIKSMRTNGVHWKDIGIQLAKQGLINNYTGEPYSGGGVQSIFAKMNGGKKQFPPKVLVKTNTTPKQPVPIKASEIDFPIVPTELDVQDLVELLTKAIKKERAERSALSKGDETRALMAMRIIEKVPALEKLSDEQLEKISKLIPALFSA